MREVESGDLVTVKAYQPEHIDNLFEAVSESISELSRYETWCHPGYTRDEAADYVNWWRKVWAEGKAYYFAVEARDTGVLLGSCGLSDLSLEHKRASMGFWIRSSRTGEGFATDAARVVMRLGLEDLGLGRIEVEVAVDNAASRRVADKLGCRLEGILSHRLILPAGPVDTAMFAILGTGDPESTRG
jgi:RimJ/RimL family protein N-acetyltransferase